jgi:hypothetical protein
MTIEAVTPEIAVAITVTVKLVYANSNPQPPSYTGQHTSVADKTGNPDYNNNIESAAAVTTNATAENSRDFSKYKYITGNVTGNIAGAKYNFTGNIAIEGDFTSFEPAANLQIIFIFLNI